MMIFVYSFFSKYCELKLTIFTEESVDQRNVSFVFLVRLPLTKSLLDTNKNFHKNHLS